MASIKISDLVRSFDGEGDIVQWIEKLELVARLKDINDLAKVIPLFLEGPAFAVYSELGEEDKKDAVAIKDALPVSFVMNAFQTYEQLALRKWKEKPVDVYMTDLRRLAKLAGVTSEQLLKRAFVVELPASVQGTTGAARCGEYTTNDPVGTNDTISPSPSNERTKSQIFIDAMPK